jgi:ribonuclease HI
MSDNSVVYDAYVDGSFSAKFDKGSWAYMIVNPETDASIAEEVGLVDYTFRPELRKLRNIATECLAVMNALKFAAQFNYKLNVVYDYIGLENWVSDITTGETPWMTNNDFTWEYRQTVLAYEKCLHTMTWVKGHSGVKWNEKVDELATNLTGTN